MENIDHVKALLSSAYHDYAGSRCCFLNMCTIPGYVLAQQAIEKILKAITYYTAGKTIRLSNDKSHDLLAWRTKAKESMPSLIELDSHDLLLQRLTNAFNGKYPDAKVSPDIRSSNDLMGIDVLVITAFLSVPYPTAFFQTFILTVAGVLQPESTWGTLNNPSLIHAAESRSDELGELLMTAIRATSELQVVPAFCNAASPSITYKQAATAA